MNDIETSSRYRADQAKNLVGFLVGDVRYAVEIQKVREIVNPLPNVSLPHAPREVVGVADHRGQVLPIVDLRTRFGLQRQEPTRRTKWLIVEIEHTPVALVVDAVTEVFGAGEQQQREIPQLGGGEERRGIASVYKYLDSLVFVVDPARVASAASDIDELEAQLAIGKGGIG